MGYFHKHKTRAVFFIYCFCLIILFIFFAEILLRKKGYEPWHSEAGSVVIEPGNKFVVEHPVLGYIYLPGKFKITLNGASCFNATHSSNGLRVTSSADYCKEPVLKDEIWIFGCSFAYGWGLSDNETFPWLLQEKLPKFEIVNFGTFGYGTIHALFQFKEAIIKRHKPRVIILTYASFHDERNVFMRKRRKTVVVWRGLGNLSQPYARLSYDGKLDYGMAKAGYHDFFLSRYSSFANWLENRFNIIENYFSHSRQISRAIIKELSVLCKANEIELVVAGIISDPLTRNMLKYCAEEGISTVDISVDMNNKENKLDDGHPNFIANKKYANKLFNFLHNTTFKNIE